MKILQIPAYSNGERTASQHLSRNLSTAFDNEEIERIRICPVPSNISKDEQKEWVKLSPIVSENGLTKTVYFPIFGEKPNTVQRIIRYFTVHFKQYRRAIKQKDADILRASSTPPTQGFMASLIKKRLKIPFVYNLQDIFPDSLVTAKMTHKGSLIWKIGRKIEDYTYKNADKIIVISEDFKKNIMDKGVPEDKIVVIPNWTDTDAVKPVDRAENTLFDKYNLDREKFYVCYSGNIGLSQNMDMLLNSAIKIKEKNADIVFVLIGDGADFKRVQSRIESENIDNVISLPFEPYEMVSSVFSLGDVDLIISKPGVGKSSVPSKTWDCMATERPILAAFDLDSKLCEIINTAKCGKCVASDDENGFVSEILNLYENRDELKELGQNGKKYLDENLSKEKCLKMQIDLLYDTLKEKTAKE